MDFNSATISASVILEYGLSGSKNQIKKSFIIIN
jgi:hypothetical protein